MAKKEDNSPKFYAPNLNPVLARVAQSITPLGSYLFYQFNLKVSEEDIAKVKALRKDRWVLLCNHPSFDDGVAVFALSGRLGEIFHYMVAQEAFEGIFGSIMPRLGCYSIRRGLADRTSIATTLDLLTQPRSRLVIFPEGGCSFQNDTVMPFRTGAIQIPLQAMSRLAKKQQEVPNFHVIPVSLKYRYPQPMQDTIEATLTRLEKTLQLSPITSEFYPRLRAIANQILTDIEREYNLNISKTLDQDWNDRITHLKQIVVNRCEDQLELPHSDKSPIRERVYKIQATLEDLPDGWTSAENWTQDALYNATIRLLNFDAIYDGYVASVPTQERFLDTLTRLEREVYDINQPPPKGYRHAICRLGNPVNLKHYFDDYKQDKAATVKHLAQQFRETMQDNLG
ncbi:MAG: 1-acyl-sn-glycerol-3-phosphate acyltransferase [Jaaginema sp. PMC 1079.18]|nr:1-acyl-sn-glycerol-3-phosphate acyltransferase [Jaaginema sp. PMC 1080.18]MEC4853638.1 1-acyl-sn-glycerol-3-phosphate acyltransferase [Jaaginema sp. PMC 1079.18]MEC4868589.1 1-acyl-sn-glycerol-3-phosphate acyltransferase [Jaaginema sp. PMC 1078.18]